MEDSVPGESSFIITLRKSSVWPSVKPFVNGGLAAVLPATSSYFMLCLHYRLYLAAESSPQFLPRRMLYLHQRMPFLLFHGGVNNATLFGSYELLTRKVEALNKGSPLTLYQEAGCGLASGAIQACICHPLVVRNEGVLALWKGTSPAIPAAIASNTGMLISYDRCRIYLKETYGVREGDARLGAGIFSGLCSGACYLPISYAAGIVGYIQSPRVQSPCSFLFYALKVLKPGGGSNFYSRLARHAIFRSPGVMIMWVTLEAIRDAEESIGL